MNQKGIYIALAMYVDDFTIVANNEISRKNFIAKMKERFKLVDLGQVRWYLGVGIEQNSEGITLNQTSYIEDMIHRYGLDDAKGMASTPAFSNQEIRRKQAKSEEDCHEYGEEEELKNQRERKEEEPTEKNRYLQIVGSLLYAAVFTWPDIMFAVSLPEMPKSD